MKVKILPTPVLQRMIVAVLFAGAAYCVLFILPYHFPPGQFLWSASFAFGYNNRLAILGFTALLGLAALLLRYCRTPQPKYDFPIELHAADRGSSRLTLLVMMLIYAAATLIMYLIYESFHPWLMWEVRHFIHRSQLMERYGLRPYTEFQSEYGPLLTHTPVLVHLVLSPLGASLEQAYFTTHLLLNIAGLICVYYIFARASIGGAFRSMALIAIALAGFGLWMGLNGVLLRYVCPFASLLFGHRAFMRMHDLPSRSRYFFGSILVTLLLGVQLLLSPEVAAAFMAAWYFYACLRFRDDARVFGATLLGSAVTAILSGLVLEPEYFSGLLQFSQGANNLPLVPAAHILLFVATMFLVVPSSLTLGFSPGPLPASNCAMAALCVALLPGAFGRCDPPHVLFFGIGASMLAMIRLSKQKCYSFAYTACYCIVSIGLMQVVNAYVFFGIKPGPQAIAQIRSRLTEVAPPAEDTDPAVADTMMHLTRYPRLGLPFATFGDPLGERIVISRGQLQPEFYVGIIAVYTVEALERKLRDVDQMQYILVPQNLLTPRRGSGCREYLVNLTKWFLFPAILPCVAQDLDPSASVSDHVGSRFRQLEAFGSWAVLEQLPGQGARKIH